MVNHFVAASFLRLNFIIFSSAVSLLRKNARKPPYPHKTFNYIVLGGNPYRGCKIVCVNRYSSAMLKLDRGGIRI